MSNANALRGEISSTLCLGIFFYPHPFLSVLFTGSPYEATTSKTSTTTTTTATATVEGNPSVPVKGNNTNAFFENTLSNVNQTIEVTCCHSNKSIEIATCGLGASCEGKCSAVDAALCPSGRCTGDPCDCEYDFENPEEEEEEDGENESPSTSPSGGRKWCNPLCPVRTHPECCYNPACYKEKTETCDWIAYLTGAWILKGRGTNVQFDF